MEIFKKKSLILKIVIALVVVILFNFSAPTISQAASIGGTLLQPVVFLLTALGDGLMLLIQSILFGVNYSVITLTDDPPGSILESILDFGSGILNWGANLVDSVIGTNISSITEGWIPSVFYLPIYAISPEEIFQNKIGVLDVNFFNPNPYGETELANGAVIEEQTSTASALQATISSWYLTLRNFAMVVLLIVLLYIGIRIVASSASQERAKYKEKLFSWIVAMCLLVFMHYIMSVAVTIVEAVSEGINQINNNIAIGMENLDDYYVEVQDEEGENQYVEATTYFNENNLVQGGKYVWPTNLLGKIRIEMQLEPTGVSEDNIILRKMGYTVLYLMLVFYTVAFLVVYIKRTIMLAFLTMIAPLVAMTYPLDKMNDGNAQAFNMWLKEYIFNLLIQPFHLILYTMLVGSAIEFATDNLIYSVVAIGFIFQAEKLLRKFFGFNKAETLDTNGSTIAGMAGMTAINALKRVGRGKGRDKSEKNNSNENSGNNGKIRTPDKGRSTRDLLGQLVQSQRQGNGQRNAQAVATGTLLGQENDQRNAQEDDNFELPLYDPELEAREEAMAKYRSDGYDQNANGEYYNPWTEEYDKNYNPADDENYNARLHQQNLANARALERYRSEGYTRNANGEYYNPWTEEYDHNYDPTKDENYNDFLREPEIYEPMRQRLGLDAQPNQMQQGMQQPEQQQVSPFEQQQVTLQPEQQLGTLQQEQQVPQTANIRGMASRNENKERNKNRSNPIKGVAAVAGKAAKYAIPKAGKLYAKAALGVAGTTIGVAAALTSADDRNILSWGGAGAAGGWAAGATIAKAGPNMVKNTTNTVKNLGENIASTYTLAAGGKQAEKERLQAKEDNIAARDKERQKLYRNKLGVPKSEMKQVMEEYKEYRKSGVTDDDIIIKAMQADDDIFGQGRASKEKIILAGLASDVGKDNKAIKTLEDRLSEIGLSKEYVKTYIDKIREINDVI